MAYPSAAVTTSGVATIAALTSKGLTGVFEALIAANPATVAPTVAPTATATGGGATGGLLAAGTYYFVHTETNAFGETTQGPQGVQLTVASTNIPQFTFPALKTGNIARNLFLGAVNGASGGPYTLYATGITTTTFNAAVAAPTNSFAVAPPAVNTTGMTYTDANGRTVSKPVELLRSFEKGNGQVAYDYLRQVLTAFLTGEPQPFNAAMMKINHARGVFAALHQVCLDIGTVVDANPGTLTTTAWGAGLRKAVRTQP